MGCFGDIDQRGGEGGSYLRSHCALRARGRGLCEGCSFFLIRERTNQERGPKGTALWKPASVCALMLRFASPRLRVVRQQNRSILGAISRAQDGCSAGLVSPLFVVDVRRGAWAFVSRCLFRQWRSFCVCSAGCKSFLARAFAIYPIGFPSKHYKNYIRTNSQKLEEAVIRGTS